MAGENDRIYSYNGPVYRNAGGPPQFYSFTAVRSAFRNQPVTITDGTLGVLDHQGHIVPQNILNQVLDGVMVYMAANCATVEAAVNYITNLGPAWLFDAYNYGNALGIQLFDFDEADPEDRFGTLFSIVTWNPVNLCRAPSDNLRGGYPGNNIDVQVAQYLAAHTVAQGVDLAWLAALNNIIANTNVNTITAYLDACSATLNGQLVAGIGYYQFPWEYADQQAEFIALSPDLDAVGGKVLIPAKK